MKKRSFFHNLKKCISNNRGASAVFAIVGFMFAAMIALVVVTAAYSNAIRVKKLKYEEQSFLMAQSVAGLLTEALAGDTNPFKTNRDKYPEGVNVADGLVLNYSCVELKDAEKFYNPAITGTYTQIPKTATLTNDQKDSFFTITGKTLPADAKTAYRNVIRNMAAELSYKGITAAPIERTLETKPVIDGATYTITTKLTMNANYSLKAITEVKVSTTTYILNMSADALAVTETVVGTGTITKNPASGIAEGVVITSATPPAEVSDTETTVKIKDRYITWPADSISTVYSLTTS